MISYHIMVYYLVLYMVFRYIYTYGYSLVTSLCSVFELVIEFIDFVHVSQKLSTFARSCAHFTDVVHVSQAPPKNVRVQLLWKERL